MRRTLKVILLLFFLASIGLLTFKVLSALKEKGMVQNRIANLPEFHFKTLDNESFTNSQLSKGIKKILMHFNSECNICQNEAVKFREHATELGNVEVLYISSESPDKIKEFGKRYGLVDMENVTMLVDGEGFYQTWVKSTQVPYMLVYDGDSDLIFQHKGLVDFERLLKSIRK